MQSVPKRLAASAEHPARLTLKYFEWAADEAVSGIMGKHRSCQRLAMDVKGSIEPIKRPSSEHMLTSCVMPSEKVT